ncbi:6-phosphogluconolactonase [Candidatus Roizmanbacteria bacterium]|nr:6-phosphogluconolactonase [Candidatus Roizmanbacteria bacterium]
MIRIHKEKDEIATKKKAAKFINSLLKKYEEKPILLMLSGGSAIEILYFVSIESFGENVTITVLDERFSKDPKANNFAMLSQTGFYQKMKKKRRVNFWDTRVWEGETPEGLTDRFGGYIQGWINGYKPEKDGKIIITQGVGENGHTAGIMPYPENPELFKKLFDDPKRWVTGYDAKGKNKYPLRITVTLPFLKEKVDHSIVYMVGEEKREVFERLVAKEGTPLETPGRIIHEMKNVQLFTDLRITI